ncbi:chromosome partitioning protein ParA [Aliivibrio sp. S4TY2]|uniref:Chromosome partitioning protein ParA n=1 Tax=Aliivibrio finisterrensis TaxID=511998 RepID=A0A4Q5KXR2_9GAMM|nr:MULTISPECIES: chromosome partitioning protein ParA [Aliivibrio]MDD9156281.1 chromosome partitioning protein ParA [Aliivibrio sp. S4TY2]MDD9160628.1 chromosome partitioning protein ParA [Aliivibrio sp. S4TY1]MDD9163988.1 chromosome partitioning protein ParA [Aliivibrio sp. S4MY2]MDD9168037.1 chromosome partitioning protein ParA [Aliivibrio sp. S4MY4]MDD9177180.1 chromosome partitioning protein ParA [Aliivibrio sp. A6]
MNASLLDTLRNTNPDDFKAIEAAIKVVKKEQYKARKEPAELLIKSVKTNLTNLEHQELIKKQCAAGYSKLSSFIRDVINNAVKVKPIVLEPSKTFFSKTSDLTNYIETIAEHIECGRTLNKDEATATLIVLQGLRREFQATRHLLVNSFTQEAAYEVAREHLTIEQLLALLQEKECQHDL